MPPRWESPFDPSPRDTALLAEVLGALQSHLSESAQEGGESSDAPLDAGVQELITAAIAELHRVAPVVRAEAGVAPVLGSGVVQELLRRRREARAAQPAPAEPTVDTLR